MKQWPTQKEIDDAYVNHDDLSVTSCHSWRAAIDWLKDLMTRGDGNE